jgi:hypothetical protein
MNRGNKAKKQTVEATVLLGDIGRSTPKDRPVREPHSSDGPTDPAQGQDRGHHAQALSTKAMPDDKGEAQYSRFVAQLNGPQSAGL